MKTKKRFLLFPAAAVLIIALLTVLFVTAGANDDVYSVTVSLNKNDAAWIGSDLTVYLQNSSNSALKYPMTEAEGTNTYTASSVPNGTYVVYIPLTKGGNPGSSKKYAGTLTVSNAGATKTINYYSVSLIAGTGINQSKLTGGIDWIIAGGSRRIGAADAVMEGYEWGNWTNADGSLFSATQSNLSIAGISKAYRLTANAVPKTYTVTVSLNKNDAPWNDSNLTAYLQNSSNSALKYPMTAVAGTNTYTVSSVPNGTYVVYIPQTAGSAPGSTQRLAGTLTVSNANASKTLNYYSVTLIGGTGINQSKLTGGIDWIIAGGSRRIGAASAVMENYQWGNWTNADGSFFSATQSNLSIAGISKEYRLTANAVPKAYNVTVSLNKNDAPWNDSNLTAYLQNSSNSALKYPMTAVAGTNTYTVSSVPNGTYIVYIPQTAGSAPGNTQRLAGTLTVSNANASKTLNYYSVTLIGGTGINQSKLTGGIAWIIAGGSRRIGAASAVMDGYRWDNWTNADGSFFSATQSNLSIAGISKAYTLTANAVCTHTIEIIPAVPATCTETGLTEGARCAVCGEIITQPEVTPALGHTPTEIPAVPATCTETGLTAGTRCTVCGEIITQPEVTPALGHDLTETPAVPATCLAEGCNAYYTCGRCGLVFSDAEGENETTVQALATAVLPHSYTGSAVSNEDGTHNVQCVNGCGEYATSDCVFGDWEVITEATCDKDGVRAHTCTVCGYTVEESYEAHEYIWAHYPATCVAGAFREKLCKNCGRITATVLEENTEPIGSHDVPDTAVTVPPTCTEEGYDEKRCRRTYTITFYDENDEVRLPERDKTEQCSYAEKENPVDPLGHNLPEANWVETQAPSCLAGGVEECVCLRCGETFTRETESLGGHTYKVGGHEATCTEDGVRQMACVNCGNILWSEVIPKGHTWSTPSSYNTISKSTCVTPGQYIRSCDKCSVPLSDLKVGDIVLTAVETDDLDAETYGTIAAINGDGTYTLDFSILGDDLEGFQDVYAADKISTPTSELVDLPLTEHKLQKTVDQVSTCENPGSYHYEGTCSVCHQTFSAERPIVTPALGHSWDRKEPTCTEPVRCQREGCGAIKAPALGHDFTINSCVLSPNAEGFYCRRCQLMTADKTGTMINLLNLIKSDAYMNPANANPKKLTSFTKTRTNTINKEFDFGIYTSLVKNIYEQDFKETSVEYICRMPESIGERFPLLRYTNNGQPIVVKTGENGFGNNDLTNIKVELLSTLNVNDLLQDFRENDDAGKTPDLSHYSDRTVNNVIKISLDVADDIYSKTANNNVNNQYEMIGSYKRYLYDTHITKIFDYDIRELVDEAKFSEDKWTIEDGKEEDGYRMEIQLKSVKTDARITYYFTADTYQPIGAIYALKETMDQSISMNILSVDGTIVPVITTDRTYLYLFDDFFNS
jgi:hypothetical protein